MNQFKISTRLIFLIGFASLLLVLIGGLGLYGISKTNDALKSVYEDRTVPMAQIADIDKLNLRIRLAIAGALINPVPEEVANGTAVAEANMLAIGKIWATYMATTLTPKEAEIAKQLALDRGRFVTEALKPAVAALDAQDFEAAKRITLERTRTLYGPVDAGLDALMKLQIDIAREEFDAATARYSTIRMVSITAIGACVLFAVLFGAALIRGMSRALRLASKAADAAASGDLSHIVTVEGKDEISHVLSSFATMQVNLIGVVSKVRHGADGVATASAQIAAGNHDLSARTETQASALEQTAASMEQLSATVKQNADNARQANQFAQEASTVAVQGGEVVTEVVATMRGINDASRKIADIISVIDGIAFQTNILALNAAVEAARAGEQGRGFAVVATEVRALAGRSASAAKEIKALIDTSVARVDQGSALVDKAGVTMTEVVTAIKRVTDLMGEISAASHEQSLGVSQVGEAVMHMDQVTQQNAALVEEMAAAASSLTEQAQDLVASMEVFKLEDDKTPAGTPTTATRLKADTNWHLYEASAAAKSAILRPMIDTSRAVAMRMQHPSRALQARAVAPQLAETNWSSF
ncbi:methyl-accepting chemotaxis protein [Rhodoferax antarcticus]|nr:methyl-accepting chemotaxis protein [Rhodoferax antarcticus]APW47729.1 methyl-accepting chemotaxis protein [Rhodoferax antarcticus]